MPKAYISAQLELKWENKGEGEGNELGEVVGEAFLYKVS